MAFVYKKRAPEIVQARAISSGNDFKGFIKNEYTTYQAKDGDNWVRLLPPTWDEAQHYGWDVYVHFSIGPDKASVLCNAKMFKTRCPICDAQQVALKAGDEELSKELRPNKRVLAWILDRQEASKGPLIWSMSYTQDKDICAISTDAMTGEYYALDDPDGGFDITFKKKGKGLNTEYNGYQVARRHSSVDRVHIDYIVNNPLPETLLPRDYDEVKTIFEGLPMDAGSTAKPAVAAARPAGRLPEPVEDDIPWERIDKETGEVTTGTGTPPPEDKSAPVIARRTVGAPAPAAAAAAAAAGSQSVADRAAALRAKFGNRK
jgi:hypothetical protein